MRVREDLIDEEKGIEQHQKTSTSYTFLKKIDLGLLVYSLVVCMYAI